jgi:hypothetical protein
MTKLELIRLVGDLITELDVLRSSFSRGTDIRRCLDDRRDDLDAQQRQLVRSVLQDNTVRFREFAMEANTVAATLKLTINNSNRVAETLENLVALLDVIQKIVKFIP